MITNKLQKNIFLIGFMGSGKTSVSLQLSDMTGLKKQEMDQILTQREKMTVAEIFERKGEPFFREQETVLLKQFGGGDPQIISCGGGVVLRECNVEQMKKNGRVVLLTASPEEVYERVKDSDDRPVLAGRKNVKGIAELMEARSEKYEAAADIIVNTDHKTVLQVCEELVQRLTEMDGE